MPPKGKDHNPSGLGRAIINQKVKDARRAQESGLFTTDIDNSTRLKSITQERDLDEFLNTAQLAGIEFTAERRNVKIVQQSGSQNPFLLDEREQQDTLRRHEENSKRLLVPRRPPWTKSMTLAELDRQERAAFLGWRRGLAQLQEEDKFLLTPFERNLEVWRQLWRVLERSHLVVQIVDARNPLHFRCEDLESYVLEVEGNEEDAFVGKGKRRNLLLLNKADLLTPEQRREWSSYFERHGIEYVFYSAANAVALQQARQEADSGAVIVSDGSNKDATEQNGAPSDTSSSSPSDSDGAVEESSDSDTESDPSKAPVDVQDPKSKILTVSELEELFLRKAPNLSGMKNVLFEFAQPSGEQSTKLVVGLVGYPNVGKSSTINSLLGEKRVSVSSTPGKTKHFQTIHLSESIVLCDCPGLVFPQFATTKAELVCDGVLPIDQLREHTGPTTLVAQRIPKEVLEATYGISIRVKSVEEGGDGKVSAQNLLQAYAIARGFMRSSQGNPDEARAARYVLKDYVNGKLLFSHPPPGVSPDDFNKPTHIRSLKRAMGKKRAPATRVTKDSDTFVPSEPTFRSAASSRGLKSSAFDQAFFQGHTLSHRPYMAGSAAHGKKFARLKAFPHQNAVADDGTPLDPQKARLATLMDHVVHGGKRHKKMKREKQRSGRGYDDD
ncbi:hypothetical protein M378DRAFT_174947 [Amanita muscaria Koide BX008]|uniref:CP-type G domain-containing protein n=1 Tax=Amanita muscaria (strain Koide BX008) TaxID=946122 RepID=A0A0C2XQ46_AMAMK|nr:hypothetical protein M378DRAFT_174947 [Amanita muscaria Koide BX008]